MSIKKLKLAKTAPDTEDMRKDLKPIQSVPMGDGIELWKVNIAVLQEQSLNARSMPSDAFLQLTDNIGRRGALESLPLIALTDVGLEIVSGHHRVRAARKANVTEIWVLVDITGLSRDEIRAKQLAHNSLQGIDNEELIRQIFDQIEDADGRIEAFIEPEMKKSDFTFNLTTKDLEMEFDTKVVSILFLPLQSKEFKHALEQLALIETDEVFLATRDEYDTMISAMDVAAAEFEITSTPTLLAKMAQVTLAYIDMQKAKKDPTAE